MSDAAQRLIERLRANRSHWVDLPSGRRVQFLRPPETELGKFVGGVRLEHVIQYVCGWEGFSEATLLGPRVGSSDALPFEPALWAEIVRDDVSTMSAVAAAIARSTEDYLKQREAAAKNSEPSST